ncbi:DNA-binding CsgD family transcriptional regulator [Streptomyces achromogenes]|uniref:DNA-binding CsgD family transcriptional regulator n=1 Tax=Streptomyces achromogenes TaxID=67255 RepID=A0ABU0Q427_STRAH|nr:LuxR C-terminal-related transcriptional regulator [Streptomyces achromogenes]MDQ0684926.1 DNA-binding CsgD family transcriptional regulator [Streptomyces achromogenes]MDQ0832103.1 DNA-binding CsgD family transcriptional regulator [Streptomyces achromogenes]
MGNLLAFLGVNDEEERLYRALLRRDSSASGSEESGRDEPTSSEQSALDGLVALGLATRNTHGAIRPVPPPRAVDTLIDGRLRRLREDLESEAARHSVIESLFRERLTAAPSPRADTDDHSRMITQLHGIEAVREAIDELTFFARTEDLTTEPTGRLTEESIAVSHPINMRLLRRGVRMRMIMGSAILQHDTTLTYMRDLVSHGAEVRISHHPIERVIIVDRSAALTPIDPAHTSVGALLVREPGLVATLVTLFERMWAAAEELPGEDTDLPSDIEREILVMLREADKDETAARRLGVSVRTYRKHLAVIMRRLGAANRVEAALIALEKGWLN